MENRRKHIAGLFTLPLIFATGLLSFAHGANDVANAVGPLAGIVAAAQTGLANTGKVALPMWVMAIGAVGIALGLSLFGPGLIRTVGQKITKMDTIRAYCVALSAAITVLIASTLGLPVSSTHIAIGAVFGVGYLREYISNTGVPNPAVRPRTMFLEPTRLNETPEQALVNYPEAREAQAGAPPACLRHRRGLAHYRAGGGFVGRGALLADDRLSRAELPRERAGSISPPARPAARRTTDVWLPAGSPSDGGGSPFSGQSSSWRVTRSGYISTSIILRRMASVLNVR